MVNGYAICLKEWILDREIRNELPLLLLISNLCAKIGYCYASNKYFADALELDECVISKKIKKLADKGYVFTEYKRRGCEIVERKLRLSKMTTDDCQKNQSTIVKNDKENNTSVNNKKEINKEKIFSLGLEDGLVQKTEQGTVGVSQETATEAQTLDKKKVKGWAPPTLAEVEAYCKERNSCVDAKYFYDYFTAGDWYDAQGKKVKSWKQKLISWEGRNNKKEEKQQTRALSLVMED